MRLERGMIMLVADGSRMLLLRNEGDEVYPDLRVIMHRGFENLRNRDLMTDAPGVGHAGRFGTSGYRGRATFEDADPHQANEDRFVAEAASALGKTARTNHGDLVVVAPPHTLGVLRRHYDRTVKARLVAEIAKDLTKHPIEEIARLIVAERAGHIEG